MSYKTDYARVAGLGSAKDGVKHWWEMKLTAVALIPLSLWALITLAGAIGQGREAAVAALSAPFDAVMMILFLAVAFRHLQQGLQEVIVDYVSDHGMRLAALIANALFCAFFGFAGVFAVAKIAFAG